jgi:hypothetical protein
MPRTLHAVVGLLAAGLAANEAHACLAVAQERMPFHETVPANVVAPVIARVTVTALIEAPSGGSPHARDNPYSYVGMVRVDRVIRGAIDERHIKLIAPATDCDYGFDLGSSGIVIGETRRDERGMLELVVTVSRRAYGPN